MKSDKDLIKSILNGSTDFDFASIHPMLEGASFDTYEKLSEFSKSNLGDDLSAKFGPKDKVVDGKYRKAHLFFFRYDECIFIAKTEKGDRGSSWSLLLDSDDLKKEFQHRMIKLDDAPVLKNFFVQLHEDLYSEPLLLTNVEDKPTIVKSKGP